VNASVLRRRSFLVWLLFCLTVGARAQTSSGSWSTGLYAYDGSGNVKSIGGETYVYDEHGRITLVNDARVSSEWTIRDNDGRVLRRFSEAGGTWNWTEDYIYGEGQLLAAEVQGPERTLHFHADHLGTLRVITGSGGAEVSRHTYYPFGREITSPAQDTERLKFTGHERDDVNLDYMHARYYFPYAGRFLSVDPGKDWDLRQPQSWNMYSYVRNNPVNATDPDGRQAVIEFVAPYAPQVIASFATMYFLSRYSLHARANMRSRPGPVLVPCCLSDRTS